MWLFRCGALVRLWQILLQKSAITVREDCLDLLTRLPTMPLFGER